MESKLQALEHSINLLEEKSLHWSIFLNEQSINLTESEFDEFNQALDQNAIAIEKAACEIEKALNLIKQKSKNKPSSTEIIAKHQNRFNELVLEIAENS